MPRGGPLRRRAAERCDRAAEAQGGASAGWATQSVRKRNARCAKGAYLGIR